jgi:phytoene dehydrogenase-like protein
MQILRGFLLPASFTPPLMHEYDAVIIGSGPNGLGAAIALAQKGWRTLVIEAAATVGGGMRSKELTLPGYTHDVCSAVHPTAVASPFFQSLDLASHGLRWIQPELPLVHPLDHGRAGVLHRSVTETATGLPRDDTAYRLLFKSLVGKAALMYPDILSPLRLPRHPLLMARFGIAAMLPATVLARSLFRSAEAQALWAGNAAHSILPLSQPFTSAVAMMLQMSAHAVGWPVAAGGSQAIADALLSKLHSLGGHVQCDWPVRSFAELPKARAYLFDTSPSQLSAIAAEALPQSYRRRLEAFRHGPGMCKVDYALDGPVPWLNDQARRAGTVHVGGTLDEIRSSELDAFEGRLNPRPFVLVAQQSVCDPSRAPVGKHTLWAYCHAPAHCNADLEPTITAQIERFAPGFRDQILAKHVTTSTQMQAYNANYIGGDIAGGATSWDQLLTRPVLSLCPYATPHPQVFLCSASTPPAGGVHGMCGWNAAQAVLKRVRW